MEIARSMSKMTVHRWARTVAANDGPRRMVGQGHVTVPGIRSLLIVVRHERLRSGPEGSQRGPFNVARVRIDVKPRGVCANCIAGELARDPVRGARYRGSVSRSYVRDSAWKVSRERSLMPLVPAQTW